MFLRWIPILFLCLDSIGAAAAPKSAYHRDFWNPTYQMYPLAYCRFDETTCGIPVANRYCRLLGYERASRAVKANNVGFTHYLLTKRACKGWGCHGFKLITCEHKIRHEPAAPYYYREKQFVVPRFNHYRVAWCLEKNRDCGAPAAHSFCRRLGYAKASAFEQQKAVPATKTLGSQALCFLKGCDGFKSITCYR